MSIFKIRGTRKTDFFRDFIFLSAEKKCAQKFFEKYIFYGHFNRFKTAKFFQCFAFKTEKFNFTPENRARTAKLSVPIDSAVKNTSKYVLWMCGKIFFGKL